MPDENTEVVDVLIVGGGFTGLAAARELNELGASFRLLDAFADHLGGRAYSYDPKTRPGTPLRFDHGAEYVGDLQNEVMQLIREELPEGSLVNGANLRSPYPYQVMVLDQERHKFRLDQSLFGITGIPPDLGVAAAIAIIGLLAEMTLIEIQINTLEPWKGPSHLLELDQINVWDWLGEKRWVSPVVRDLMRISIEALLSVEPSEISPYYLLWYTACNSGLLNEVNDDAGGPQQYWLSCGASALAERMADPVRDRIQQGVFVEKIDLTGDVVEVKTKSGQTHRARKVLVAMSPHTAGRIQYTPEPPPARRALMSMPMGRTLKCQVFYKSSWWHDSNGTQYNGYCGGANYPVLWVMDNSPPPGVEEGTHVLMTFTVGAQLDALGPSPTHEAIEALVTGTLRTLYEDDRALAGSDEYVRLVSYGWTAEDAFIGGGPNTVFTVGGLTGDAGKMLNEHWDDKVFFASAENAKKLDPASKSPRWNLFHEDNMPKYTDDGVLLPDPPPPYRSNYSDMRESLGYMDGAISSGRYVAHELAQSLGYAHRLRPTGELDEGPIRSHVPIRATPASEVLGVVESVKAGVERLTNDDLRAFAQRPSGPKGFASWLHHQLIGALDRDGDGTGDPVQRLTMVRDFASAAVPFFDRAQPSESEDESVLDRIRGVISDVDDLLRTKLGR